jgi:hypothetical protein
MEAIVEPFPELKRGKRARELQTNIAYCAILVK